MIGVVRAAAAMPFLCSAKLQLRIADAIHTGYGNTRAAIQQIEYAEQNLRIAIAVAKSR